MVLCFIGELFFFFIGWERVSAGDWPQILGTTRNGIALGERLLTKWPDKGPPILWRTEIGEGFAGPVVSEDKLILFHRLDQTNVVQAFAASDGKPIWKTTFPADYQGTINPDSGPRSTPMIVDGKVVVYSAEGILACFDFESGKELWKRELLSELNGDLGYFGAGSTPLAWRDQIIVNAGGKKGGVVSVSLTTGETRWTIPDEQASYSSPVSVEWEGKPRIVLLSRYHLLVIDPEAGKPIASTEFGKRGPTVSAAIPLVHRKEIFVSASYGIGAKLFRAEQAELEELWGNDTSLSSQYTTGIVYQGHLYGTDGREDGGKTSLRCIEWESGKIKWEKKDFPLSHLIQSEDYLLAVSINGQVALLRPSAEKPDFIATAQLVSAECRAIPALSRGRLFLRTNAERDGKGILLAVQVGE